MPPTPRDHLRTVIAIVEAHGPPDVAGWLAAGVSEFEAGAARSLDVALGLRGRGIELPPRLLARAERDAALSRAWFLFDIHPDETVATRGRRFAAWLADFGARRWPRLCAGARPAASALEVQAGAAFAAAEGGPLKVPVSWDRLRAIVLVE